jgi:hypothetical protein
MARIEYPVQTFYGVGDDELEAIHKAMKQSRDFMSSLPNTNRTRAEYSGVMNTPETLSDGKLRVRIFLKYITED